MKSIVLLSAGLDSTVNLYEALQKTDVQLALTFDYGQRAKDAEIKAARGLTQLTGVSHQVVELPFFKGFGKSSLIDTQKTVPVGDEVLIDDLGQSQKTASSVWVPNRNGIFLNIAAGFAESLGAQLIIPGFNLEEATTFPDNSRAFMEVMTQSLSFSTQNHVQVECFTDKLSKTEIVKRGLELKVPFTKIWPCYFADAPKAELWCGECESCKRSLRAFRVNGVDLGSLPIRKV